METIVHFFTSKLQRKLMLALVLLVVLIMGVAGGYWLSEQQQTATAELDARARQMTDLLGQTLGTPLWNLDQKAIYDQLEAVMADPSVFSVSLYEEDAEEPRAFLERDDPPVDPIQSVAPVVFVQGEAEPIEIGSIQLIYTRQYMYEAMATNRGVILTIFLFLTFIIALSTYLLLQYMVVRPVGEIARLTQRIAGGNYATRIEVAFNDEIGQLANSSNQMAAQLQDSIDTLEHRVAERTRDLKITADVSRQITTVLDLDLLLRQLTQTTQQAFELYYVSVFLYDPETEELVLAEGANAQGERLIPQRLAFHIEARPSLVAKAAREQKVVVVNDVSRENAYAQHEFFPDTQSETNLPMLIGDTLLGVLGLQSNHKNRFTPADVEIFTILAEQMAVAVRNAQLYQKQILLAEKLRAADVTKGRFLASMSHELRTPLNGIINFTEMVALGMIGPIGDEQASLLNQALESSRHLLNLINDVLDMSKIEAGMLSLLMEPDVDVVVEAQSALKMVEPFLHGRPVHITAILAPDLPRLTADKRRIRQILLNLLSNAIKFTDEGTITLKGERQGDDIVLKVIDNGPGIAPDMQTTIFEPFVQTADGVKQSEGTGLGLPIAKNLAEAHGGRLWVESVLGHGATFCVSFPINGVLSPKQPPTK
jgi:signal transduction histidine kinase/HAMP domain-containing protein